MGDSRRIAVGAFVLGGLVLFGLGLFMIGDRRRLFEESFEVYAEFAKLAGLQNGAKVRVAGVDAGEVENIEYPPSPAEKFRVKMRIVEDLHPLVRMDSVAGIQTDGLVGNKLVSVGAGSEEAPVVPEGGTIESLEPFELADLMQQASGALATLEQTVVMVWTELSDTIEHIETAVRQADEVFRVAGEDIKAMADAGKTISEDMERIVADVRAGKGTIGKLVNDEALYEQARDITARVQTISADAEKAFANIRDLTEDAEATFAEFRSEEGPAPGFIADLRRTLDAAREAMSDMAENTESMKRSFLFRGLFLDRGFFDLNAITPQEYVEGALLDTHRVLRTRIPAGELFDITENGEEVLSEQGKAKINSAMREILLYPPNSPLMVEGYADSGSLDERFLVARSRAFTVRDYIVRKFHRDPNYTGFLSMESVKSQLDDDGGEEDNEPAGVVLSLFYDNEAAPAPRHRTIH